MVDGLGFEPEQQRIDRLAGVGDREVDPAKPPYRFADDSLYRSLDPSRRLQRLRNCTGTSVRARGGALCKRVHVSSDERDVGAVAREFDRDRAADPTAAARDERRLPGEFIRSPPRVPR